MIRKIEKNRDKEKEFMENSWELTIICVAPRSGFCSLLLFGN